MTPSRRDLPRLLADHRDDLSVPGLGALQRLAKLIHLAVAPTKAGQPTVVSSMKSGAHGPRADELVYPTGSGGFWAGAEP